MLKIGESIQFNYTGSMQSITLLPGIYRLQCYGAQGYALLDGIGGKGGYAQGEITLYDTETLYVYVGGQTTGYNGGEGNQPGGGATHIAKVSGLLKTLSAQKDKVIIVAGGGGGAERVQGGAGGGLTGGSGSGSYSYLSRNGAGGTQTSGGLYGVTSNYGNAQSGGFGYGGHGNAGDSGPTGGGGWYGGGGVTYAGGAGGGSSYIGHVHLTNASTLSGVRTGNGYAIITYISPVLLTERHNTNFYKNTIHEETYEYQEHDNIRKTYQENHGFIIGDPIYYDEIYKKANIEDTINVIGVVSEVIDENTFIYKNSGKILMDKRISLPGDILYLTKDGLRNEPDGVIKQIGIQLPDGIIVKILQAIINEEVT